VNNSFSGKPQASSLNLASACGSPLNYNTQYMNESTGCCTNPSLSINANHPSDHSHLPKVKETAP
jgi:hypothetical protein